MIAQNELALPNGVVALSYDEMNEVDGGVLGAIIGAALVITAVAGGVYLVGYAVGYVANM